MAATLWTSSTPNTSPTSQYLSPGWSFCLGAEGSRLNTSGTPDSRPMDTEVRLTSIDFNLREAKAGGTGLLIVQDIGGVKTIIGKSDNVITTGSYAPGTWTFSNGPVLNTAATYYAMFTQTDLTTVNPGDTWKTEFFSINGSQRVDIPNDNKDGTGPAIEQLALVGSNTQKIFDKLPQNYNMVPVGLNIHTMAVPEPATFSLLMLGMTALAFRRSRTALQ